MIGNDIVDLHLSRLESNWQRKGWLKKIFTPNEQIIIQNADNQELMVWYLWTRKEAAYKIYVQETRVVGFFPQKIECSLDHTNCGTTVINSKLYHTKTEVTNDFIYSIALKNIDDFNCVITLGNRNSIVKNNQIPTFNEIENNTVNFVSITNHGRFERIIMLKPFIVPNLF